MRLAEALVALVVVLLVVATGWRLAAAQGAAVRALDGRARELDAVRTAILVLDWELADRHAARLEGEALTARVWRGWGRVCAARVEGAVVAWEGLRAPDPSRDSLLLVDVGGGVHHVRLTGQRRLDPGAVEMCAGEEVRELRWTGQPLPPGGLPAWVRLHEVGSYRVADALRYRRGRGAPQPLTEALFDPSLSRWRSATGGVSLDLATPSARVEASW